MSDTLYTAKVTYTEPGGVVLIRMINLTGEDTVHTIRDKALSGKPAGFSLHNIKVETNK